MYAPLWCKSHFSFLEGASRPEELIEQCHVLGLQHMALTDRDGVYGVVEAHSRAQELGIHLILGSEISIDDGSKLVLLAKNREGYAQLCRLITLGRRRSHKGKSCVSWQEIYEHDKGLVALWGGAHSLLVQNQDPYSIAQALKEAFKHDLYALIARHCLAAETKQEALLRERAEAYHIPLVASTEILYHCKTRKPLQDILTCIRHGVTIQTAKRLISANGEHALHAQASFQRLFADDPAAIERSLEIALQCQFSLTEIRYRYPSESLPNGKTSASWLEELCFQGANRIYDHAIPARVRQQIEKELKLIGSLDYCGYFLTMCDIVEYCKAHDILCQGRGSAANSIVCYCLGITAVDPIRLDLLFERFISLERAEPPDIDLDIEHQRREEVIRYVYGKYGRDHAAMVANIIRYRPKSAIRDVGKALGFSEAPLNRLSKLLSHHDTDYVEAFGHAGLDSTHNSSQLLMTLATEILDFPRHLSIHPGGFLLGHDPVCELVPIENASMPGRTVIQWDKNSVETLGLFKVDLLGLGALSQLHASFDLLQQHYGAAVSMASIPAQDEATFKMIQQGNTVGVFQIESRAQMSMLPRLKPENFYDLVVQISIVRPGPITGGMVHPYLRRRAGEEKVTYPHPCLKPVLEKTLGVPLFQEQVMKLAMVAADYTPGEADQLRRDMAAWRKRGSIERHRERLVSRMQAKGITLEFAERIFDQIRGFGEYGFPESHAASFALIAYASAWLRCHYPDVFSCALLNSQPMGFYSVDTIVNDAKRQGVKMLPVCIRHSQWDCTLESAGVRMGLRFVKHLNKTHVERMLNERATSPFLTLGDVTRRTYLNRDELEQLAQAGAFETLAVTRRDSMWELRKLTHERYDSLALPSAEENIELKPLSAAESIQWDYQSTGHSPRGHLLKHLRDHLRALGCPDAKSVRLEPHGKLLDYAGMVICRQRPSTAGGVVFMTLEDETGFVNVVIWNKVFEQYKALAKTASLVGVFGRLQHQHQDGVIHLIAHKLWQPPLRVPTVSSRDFH